MKSCYVAMPFGIKTDFQTGEQVDFDKIFHTLIVPAISNTQYAVFRSDAVPGVQIMKSILKSVISSDIMIADISMQNPNVLYELGIRHMAQRGQTILICRSGTNIPWNISSFKVISYDLNHDGSVSEKSANSFRKLLNYSLESNLDQNQIDSPVYLSFPEIKVSLPYDLISSESKNYSAKKFVEKIKIPQPTLGNREKFISDLNVNKSIILSNPDSVDPIEYVKLLKHYRDASAWNELVTFAESIPDELSRSPEMQQLYALALNRLGRSEKAIAVMEELVDKTGGDSESFGVLGRVYKDLFETNKKSKRDDLAHKFLDKAIENYEAGFEKQPNEYYTGVNLVNLLMQKQDSTSEAKLHAVLPKVRLALKNKMDERPPDFWEYATALELAVIAREWNVAKEQIPLALKTSPSSWMLESTVRNLSLLQSVMHGNDKTNVGEVILMLSKLEEGLPNAK